jgi:hypothetical protein
MKKCVTFFFLSGILLLISGCSFQGGSSGNTVIGESDKAQIYKIINDNITTKSDARRVLGDPSDIDYYETSKQEKWTYQHLDKSNLMRNYIPVFNFFSRGTKDIRKKIILIFSSDGVLVRSMVSESVAESKNGMFD